MPFFPSSSSSSSNSNFTLFSPTQNPNTLSKFSFKIPIIPLHSSSNLNTTTTTTTTTTTLTSSCSSKDSNTPVLEQLSQNDVVSVEKELVVRRPVMTADQFSGEGESVKVKEEGNEKKVSKGPDIDVGLTKLAKKMPIFEPEQRVVERFGSTENPLTVNLDLALYRAKVLSRNFRYQEAEEMLQKCINYWPEDGRAYVALGKILGKQSKVAEARAVYEKGCQATQGENPYIWQCWAVLENKMGNTRRARELFDAATVANKRHIAAWHGWAVLELKQGNIKKARQLLAKGLKFCGGNEYIYQTLAMLEAKANRYEQARYLFRQATKYNPKSCASWLKAVQASPKNRFAWHVWGVFEANMGNISKGKKLLKIGHALNPRDPVLLQSLALLEYKYSSANIARVLFRRASELDPRHQPVWIAWGWMEWKEGNIEKARELYQRALSINSTSESAARCLQAWGVLEQKVGNLSAARRLFRSSLNINSQSYITWMTWASLEEKQGNSVRAEEIRNLYFQQRTEVVDDASWVMGFLDIIDPAIDSIKRFLKLDQESFNKVKDSMENIPEINGNSTDKESVSPSAGSVDGKDNESGTGMDLDAFISEKLSLDPSKLEVQMESSKSFVTNKTRPTRRVWRSENRTTAIFHLAK
ncbi:hypothetical protein RGQ29_023590 [Quercus rubra]|uniref:PsbB mRNA maturation factor Mbb1 n=1 Tax=Quercus rubra TaxID=3512 RepID=A0AAN7F6C6_QUERU|nr:hypothetical protein RGQ29_023590 [Quercus rubra]